VGCPDLFKGDNMNDFIPLNQAERDRIVQEILDDCDIDVDCWVYRQPNGEGYGVRRIAGRSRSVARFMLAASCGLDLRMVSQEVQACHDDHKCRFRSCCNPKHLYWGTKEQNAKDRERSEREANALTCWFMVELTRQVLKQVVENGVDSSLFALDDHMIYV
jgi:hypothetical protein